MFDAQNLMKTNIEFQKLEKVELGGINGKTLSCLVGSIFEDFNERYKVFSDGHFDCLDTEKHVSFPMASPAGWS